MSLASARADVIASIREVIEQTLHREAVYQVSVPERGRETTNMRQEADQNVEHAYAGLDESFTLYERAIKESDEL